MLTSVGRNMGARSQMMALARTLLARKQLPPNTKGVLYMFSTRNSSDDLSYRPQLQERAKSVASFYNQSGIDAAAAKVSSLLLHPLIQGYGLTMESLSPRPFHKLAITCSISASKLITQDCQTSAWLGKLEILREQIQILGKLWPLTPKIDEAT